MADSAIQELDDLANKARSARSKFEPVWYLNLAYFAGQQWVFWNRGRLYEPQLEGWRVTFTDNRINGIIRTEVAKLTKARPRFVVVPATGSENDIDNAQLGERILNHIWKNHSLERKQRAALSWSRITGAGFWKVYWDSSAGESQDFVYLNGQPMPGPDGRPMRWDPAQEAQLLQLGAVKRTIAAGDICVEVRSPFELLPDPLAGEEGIAGAEWIIEETVQSMDYCKRRWPGKQFKEDGDAITGLAESRMNPGFANDTGQYKGVKVREFWHLPGSKYPKGKYTVWANDMVLTEADMPYSRLPYVMFSGIPVPGRFWPTSVTEQLRGPQTEFNKTRSQIRENASRIGNPALLKSRQANVEYTGVPGEVIEYDDTMPNSVPSYLQPPNMPAYVENEIALIESSFREISGQHEITQGAVPAGVTAASAINLLQEQDDTRLGPDVADMELALGEAGTMILEMVAKFYAEERTARLGGEDGEWDIFDFKGSVIGENTRVEVLAGSAQPHSKAGRIALMESILTLLIQNGAPMNARDLSTYLKDMGVGGFEHLVAKLTEDEGQVHWENRQMAQGVRLPINSYDDDEAHVAGHQSYMKTSRYRTLVAANPQVAQIQEEHVAAHQDRITQNQQAQEQHQIALQAALEDMKAHAQATYNPKPPPASTNGSKK